MNQKAAAVATAAAAAAKITDNKIREDMVHTELLLLGAPSIYQGGYGLVFAQIRDVHRAIVAFGGKSRDASRPWIEVEKELRAEVGVDTLPSCGPLKCYEIMYHEIIPFMRKAIQDPLLAATDARGCTGAVVHKRDHPQICAVCCQR
jgi:hypothetical protein